MMYLEHRLASIMFSLVAYQFSLVRGCSVCKYVQITNIRIHLRDVSSKVHSKSGEALFRFNRLFVCKNSYFFFLSLSLFAFVTNFLLLRLILMHFLLSWTCSYDKYIYILICIYLFSDIWSPWSTNISEKARMGGGRRQEIDENKERKKEKLKRIQERKMQKVEQRKRKKV